MKNVQKRSAFEAIKLGLSAKIVMNNAPLDGSATSIIERELYLFRSRHSFDVNELVVPKFIFEQFKKEREYVNKSARRLHGIFIKESKISEFEYRTWSSNDDGFDPDEFKKIN